MLECLYNELRVASCKTQVAEHATHISTSGALLQSTWKWTRQHVVSSIFSSGLHLPLGCTIISLWCWRVHFQVDRICHLYAFHFYCGVKESTFKCTASANCMCFIFTVVFKSPFSHVLSLPLVCTSLYCAQGSYITLNGILYHQQVHI